jgi:hypothetical protein
MFGAKSNACSDASVTNNITWISTVDISSAADRRLRAVHPPQEPGHVVVLGRDEQDLGRHERPRQVGAQHGDDQPRAHEHGERPDAHGPQQQRRPGVTVAERRRGATERRGDQHPVRDVATHALAQ